MDSMQWKVLKSAAEVWSNDWIRVMEIWVKLPKGVETPFYFLDAADGVAVLAIDHEHRAILNRQFRPALGEVILELPAGQIEQGEERVGAVERELREESGLVAKDIQYLGSFYRNPARDTGSMHVYLARVGGSTSPRQERYEQMETVRVPLDDLIAGVLRSEIKDVTTIFAVLMLEHRRLNGEILL